MYYNWPLLATGRGGGVELFVLSLTPIVLQVSDYRLLPHETRQVYSSVQAIPARETQSSTVTM